MTAMIVIIVAALAAIVLYDVVLQRRHAILHNYPIIGHLRYILEAVGPELRQYIVTNNDEERPFSRDQRRWVYASAKQENNLFGFGTDNDLESTPGYLIIKQSTFPYKADPHAHVDDLPCAKVVGGPRGRAKAFRPASVVNTSAMSFGSLSAAAVRAINEGAKLSGSMQNTGEGGIAPHHLHGGDLIWQLGTGYFGARRPDGGLDLEELVRKCERHPVRMVEIKLSQGAKPGKGGVLPAAKVTAEIAAIRGVPAGESVLSPAWHDAFGNVGELLELVETIADRTGLPVGIKSAVGDLGFWHELAAAMEDGTRGVDFIQIDGGEGGTGAAPLAFSDHVAWPFKIAFSRVYAIFAARGVAHRIVWIGSGKLGFPAQTMLAFGMGCDMVAVAREAMLAVGCIQAQKCHTGHCPTGVATQNRWLMRGLDPTLKAARFANYVKTLRHDVLALSHACGEPHPSLVPLDRYELTDDRFGSTSAQELFGYQAGWGRPAEADQAQIRRLMDESTPGDLQRSGRGRASSRD